MINYYKINKQLITNTYINIDYVRSKDKLINVFSNDVIVSSIKNKDVFLNELIDYEANNKVGVRKDRALNYGVILTFMINNKDTKDNKIKALAEAIIKTFKLSSMPYLAFTRKYKNSLYLVFYVCERKYYSNKKTFTIYAKKDTYKNSKGVYCKANSKGAKLIHCKGDVLRKYTTHFSSKIQRTNSLLKFRYANEKQFIYTINKCKEIYIKLCEQVLKEQVSETITFKRYSIKKLDLYEKNIAKVWGKTLGLMEEAFSKTYARIKYKNSILTDSYSEQETANKKAKKDLFNIYKAYNEVLINNYENIDNIASTKMYFHANESNIKKRLSYYERVEINFKVSLQKTKQLAKDLLTYFKNDLDNLIIA